MRCGWSATRHGQAQVLHCEVIVENVRTDCSATRGVASRTAETILKSSSGLFRARHLGRLCRVSGSQTALWQQGDQLSVREQPIALVDPLLQKLKRRLVMTDLHCHPANRPCLVSAWLLRCEPGCLSQGRSKLEFYLGVTDEQKCLGPRLEGGAFERGSLAGNGLFRFWIRKQTFPSACLNSLLVLFCRVMVNSWLLCPVTNTIPGLEQGHAAVVTEKLPTSPCFTSKPHTKPLQENGTALCLPRPSRGWSLHSCRWHQGRARSSPLRSRPRR